MSRSNTSEKKKARPVNSTGGFSSGFAQIMEKPPAGDSS
jgi:hypothetical protein